ncbi:MAG TPA: ABC transporter permease [Thermodesulfovibrionales bacterium]|nr:ABC transporter permease [Thermodesulfovibrionales bacterium]
MNEELKTFMSDERNVEWTSVIRPISGWFDIHLAELWRYRDLIMLFVRRDFVSVYKQTILGPIWFLLQPIFTTLVFTIIFGRIAKIPTDGIPQPLFYMAGVVAWSYFSGCLNRTSNTFVSNANIFGKVYFPRLTVPMANVISSLISFAIQFALFLCFIAYYIMSGVSIKMTPLVLLLPLLLLQMAILGLGFGIIISSLTTKYRDLTQLVGFGVQLWMYATPVVYPISRIPEKWHWIVSLNPIAPVIEAFRYIFLGAGTVNAAQIGLSVAITVLVLFVGIMLFSRIEKSFMDTV